MKVRDTWDTRRKGAYSVDAAVQITLVRSVGRNGHLEETAAKVEAAHVFLGALTEKLHECGALSDGAVLSLLAGFEQIT